MAALSSAQSRAYSLVQARACPATAALRCPTPSHHAPVCAHSFQVSARSSSHSPSSSGGASRGGRERQPASAVNSVSAAASVLAFPQDACTDTDTEDAGVAGLGKMLVAEFAQTISPRLVDCDEETEAVATRVEPSSAGVSDSGACEGGFCTYSDEKQEAWEQQQQETKPAGLGVPTLAGLAVATFDVKSVSTKVANPTSASAASLPRQERSKPALHPEAERRRREREARKSHRRGSSMMMSQKEWWKTSAANLLEVGSESDFSEVIKAAASQGQTVIVDYYAPWCQACARQFPEIVSAAVGNPNIVFVKVNAGNLRTMCEDHGVRRLPSYGVIEPGEELWCTGFIQKLHDIMGKKRLECLG